MLLAAGCTAFYMFRLYFLVFEGEYRGGAAPVAETHGDDHDDAHAHATADHGHGHDDHGHGPGARVAAGDDGGAVDPRRRLGSLVGLLGIPDVVWPGHDLFGEWLSPVLPPLAHEESLRRVRRVRAHRARRVAARHRHRLAALRRRRLAAASSASSPRFPRLYRLVFNKYYIDEVYDFLVVRPVRYTAFVLWKAFDAFVIDLLLVNGVGFIVSGFGKLSKYLQNGDLQRYIVAVIVGGAVIVGVATHYDVWAGAKFDAKVEGRDVEVTRARRRPDGQAAAVPRRLGRRRQVFSATQMHADARSTPTTRPGKHEHRRRGDRPALGHRVTRLATR